MKRFVKYGLIIVVILSLGFYAVNKARNVYHFYGGLSIGGGSAKYDANDPNETIDSIRVIAGTAYIYSGGDTIPVYVPVADQIDNSTIFVKRIQDTVQVTAATYTLLATDASKIIRFENATYTEVTIPASTMTAGDVITMVRAAGAGPIRVNGAANVIVSSVLDSCTMNTAKQWYQIVFRTANKPDFIGDWRD